MSYANAPPNKPPHTASARRRAALSKACTDGNASMIAYAGLHRLARGDNDVQKPDHASPPHVSPRKAPKKAAESAKTKRREKPCPQRMGLMVTRLRECGRACPESRLRGPLARERLGIPHSLGVKMGPSPRGPMWGTPINWELKWAPALGVDDLQPSSDMIALRASP